MSSDNKSQLYNSLGGKTKTKFDFSNHKKAQSIGQDNFFKWTSGNMYRTSYNDMSNKVSLTKLFIISAYSQKALVKSTFFPLVIFQIHGEI